MPFAKAQSCQSCQLAQKLDFNRPVIWLTVAKDIIDQGGRYDAGQGEY
jgi:hypothetical protein